MAYHQQKKTAGFQSRKATYGSSNPQRKDDRMAEASRKNHQWRRAQYMFKNKRKKLLSEIVQVKDNRRCEVAKEEVEEYFKDLFSQPNQKTRPR
ncbi:hypothetical protein RvY_10328 [Ramazzottius varieornatus]|uniref:Uncharacterized protein n=1 Tax=Ramazzottius varieornatus TaxID=947166 RepID=A0A1D1VK62_RAMVA|nr:hypothetical protein RvY_10328 [Ramazzottius varieornatus]